MHIFRKKLLSSFLLAMSFCALDLAATVKPKATDSVKKESTQKRPVPKSKPQAPSAKNKGKSVNSGKSKKPAADAKKGQPTKTAPKEQAPAKAKVTIKTSPPKPKSRIKAAAPEVGVVPVPLEAERLMAETARLNAEAARLNAEAERLRAERETAEAARRELQRQEDIRRDEERRVAERQYYIEMIRSMVTVATTESKRDQAVSAKITEATTEAARRRTLAGPQGASAAAVSTLQKPPSDSIPSWTWRSFFARTRQPSTAEVSGAALPSLPPVSVPLQRGRSGSLSANHLRRTFSVSAISEEGGNDQPHLGNLRGSQEAP